ncbi:MAG: class I SAM-dependent methyltransferase [Phycisphaerales bacterium]|nr:MAG: class I SAM-dependent methyltransferase [Phycisphaerales bacterium]
MEENRLTEKQYWDERWDRIRLPEIVEPTTKHPIAREIIRVFDTHLPKENLSVVEIGGAPGQFAAYLSRYHHYEASIIEYSETGCRKTEENFDLLGLDVEVYLQDFFGDLSALPRFDVVLSMGFIEHFEDIEEVLQRHVALVRKGGILILGVPNLRGIGRRVLARTAPEMLSRHNLAAMDLENWRILEEKYGMTPLFKGYIGGFQPKNLKRCERRTPVNLCLRYSFKALQGLMAPFPFLSKYNSAFWSAYLLGIYRAP